MLGGIIGDLAAWTWQNDKSVFYDKLMSEEAKLSEYGAMILAMVNSVFYYSESTPIDPYKVASFLPQELRDEMPISNSISEWLVNDRLYDYPNKSFPLNDIKRALATTYSLTGWANETATGASEQARKIAIQFQIEKADFYAIQCLPKLIWGLRKGLSKEAALLTLDEHIRNLTTNLKYRADDDALGVVVRAWDAFYRSYDFTSTIYCAVKSPINPHLTAAIAGEFAEAMYGCELGFLKKKYSDNPVFVISLPRRIKVSHQDKIDFLKEKTNVEKKKKNCAMTNVERHNWISVQSKFEGKTFDKTFYETLKKAFYTDWDNRYGLYLDDGWFYVYRSYVLICRFKVIQESENHFSVANIQSSNEDVSYEIALEEAFCSLLKQNPYRREDEDYNFF